MLDMLDEPTDYPFVCKVNQCVGGNNLSIRSGYLRNAPVRMVGTTWNPDMPIESQIKEEMAEIGQIENPTDRALTMMLYLVRKQVLQKNLYCNRCILCEWIVGFSGGLKMENHFLRLFQSGQILLHFV